MRRSVMLLLLSATTFAAFSVAAPPAGSGVPNEVLNLDWRGISTRAGQCLPGAERAAAAILPEQPIAAHRGALRRVGGAPPPAAATAAAC
jgi:hypothetical protein